MKTIHATGNALKQTKKSHKSLKSKIRDIERLLRKRPDMDPAVRKQFEEQREDLQAQTSAKTQKQKLKKLYQRNKKTIFIEKKKILRRLNSLREHHKYLLDPVHNQQPLILSQNLPSTPSECLKEIIRYEDYLLYVEHFPSNQKYVSLFPTTTLTEDEQKERNDFQSAVIQQIKKSLRGKGRAGQEPESSTDTQIADHEESADEENRKDEFFLES